MMSNKGSIMAVDRYAGRLKALNEISDRLGISIINPVCGDSEKGDFLQGFARGPFDAILVDAPCSGLGVLGRTPDIKLHRSLKDIKTISETQKKLIHNLIGFLKPDGRLVYSVCTLEPEETTEIVKWFLNNHDEIRLEDAATVLPENYRPLVDKEGFLHTLPHRDKMDGFFAARFRRK
jgi:16S rRNA (cytosine967-C5)-methyltransferase